MSVKSIETPTFDPRYKTLYQLGGIASILIAIFILLAIVAYFIWPYNAKEKTIEAIFSLLQSDRIGALISLDVLMLFIGPVSMLLFPALYAALHQVYQLCKQREQVMILELNIQPDHVYVVVEIPPKYAVSEFMGYLRGKLALWT